MARSAFASRPSEPPPVTASVAQSVIDLIGNTPLVEIRRLAPDLPPGLRLHLSGCAKRCGKPPGPGVIAVGTAAGLEIAAEGMAVPPAVRALLEGVAP